VSTYAFLIQNRWFQVLQSGVEATTLPEDLRVYTNKFVVEGGMDDPLSGFRPLIYHRTAVSTHRLLFTQPILFRESGCRDFVVRP